MQGIANDMMDDIMKYSSGATNTNIEDLQNDYKPSNQIEFSERFEQQFQHNWSRYVGQSDVFQPRVATPFWHLNNEPFWRLVPYEGSDEAIAVYLGRTLPRNAQKKDSFMLSFVR